ncbi:MAG: hypothetical protein WBP33_06800, partial [Saprospiraceae bacterium]
KYFIDKQYNKILDTELNALLRFIYFFESKKSILSDYPGSDNLIKFVNYVAEPKLKESLKTAIDYMNRLLARNL